MRELRVNTDLGSAQISVLKPAVSSPGHMLHHISIGLTVKQCVHQIPAITLEASIQPITRTVLRVRLLISPDFRWNDQVKVVGPQRSSRRPCCSRDKFAGSGLSQLLRRNT